MEYTRTFPEADALIRGSDYPHSDGTWSRSREVIAQTYAVVPREDMQKMVAGNAARLFGISLN